MKLTPRQASAMLGAYNAERTESFMILGRMHGCTESDDSETKEGAEPLKFKVGNENVSDFDTKKIDDLAAKQMAELKRRAK